MNFKNMFFIILLPLFCLSSEKVNLGQYPKLEHLFKNLYKNSPSNRLLALVNL
jgi:hypothetical protein